MANANSARLFAVPQQITNKAIRNLSAARLDDLSDCKKLGKMPLYEGAMEWLESRRPFLGERSAHDYAIHIATIAHFFGSIALEKLANPDRLRAYQLERSKTCGASTVNKECSVIQQILKRIRRWHEVKPFYEPLPVKRDTPGRALTPDEEKRLFDVGKVNPKWASAYHLAVVSVNTAVGPGELLGLRFRDLFTDNPETARVYIRENAKNQYRLREVPLNTDALASMQALMAIAKSRGAGHPEHYLVPFRIRGGNDGGVYDPTRPGKWPKGSWTEWIATAGVMLRPYDLRHHGLTKLAEKNPEQVVLKIAGHVSPQMLRKIYAHVRLPALRAAVNSISSVNVCRPVRETAKPEKSETPEQTLFRVSKMADQLGIPVEKAFQFLIEYERQQALTKAERKGQ
jgi:integrase